MFTNDLEACTEALGKRLAALRRLPGISQGNRRVQCRQANAVLAGAWVPSQRLPFAQTADPLRAQPAGMKIQALWASHLG